MINSTNFKTSSRISKSVVQYSGLSRKCASGVFSDVNMAACVRVTISCKGLTFPTDACLFSDTKCIMGEGWSHQNFLSRKSTPGLLPMHSLVSLCQSCTRSHWSFCPLALSFLLTYLHNSVGKYWWGMMMGTMDQWSIMDCSSTRLDFKKCNHSRYYPEFFTSSLIFWNIYIYCISVKYK